MSKKWNSRAPSAFSSAIAVLILLSAGAAVAQQGGLQRLASGARDAMNGQDHSASAKERTAALLASPVPTRAHGGGVDGRSNGYPGTPGETCTATVALVRAAMPAADDATGVAHALSVLATNCGKNPQAHGLINAIQKLGHGNGQGGGAGKPTASPPPSQGGGAGKPTASPPPSQAGGSGKPTASPPPSQAGGSGKPTASPPPSQAGGGGKPTASPPPRSGR
jgi:hypothetical protein